MLSFLIKNPSCLVGRVSMPLSGGESEEKCVPRAIFPFFYVYCFSFSDPSLLFCCTAHSFNSCVQLSIYTHLSTDVYSIIICCCCCNHIWTQTVLYTYEIFCNVMSFTWLMVLLITGQGRNFFIFVVLFYDFMGWKEKSMK